MIPTPFNRFREEKKAWKREEENTRKMERDNRYRYIREKKAKRSERALVMGENIPVLLGRSAVDNRRQSSFTAVIGLAYSDAKCSCICMTQSRLSASQIEKEEER